MMLRFLSSTLSFLMLVACSPSKEELIIAEGKQLSDKYCQSCHELPSPDDLPKAVWNEILPLMGAKMGLATSDAEIQHRQILQQTDRAYNENSLILPQGTVSLNEWLLIKNYYRSISPDSFNIDKTQISEKPQRTFRERPIVINDLRAASSLVAFDSASIYYGDAQRNMIYKYDIKSESNSSTQLDGAPSQVLKFDGNDHVLTMGNIHPNDFQNGKLFAMEGDTVSEVLSKLQRPVHISYADLNSDNQMDYVVCGFGYLKGNLSWYEHTESGYEKHILRDLPGSLKTDILDFNGDGHLDILALIAQGDEGFFLYKGDGEGNFEEQKLYSFPPSFGSSYYELADFTSDGLLDILYVNGDNGDYSKPVHKPYQGIRILENNGNLEFQEIYHFHMNGPFKAMAEDFDLDWRP